ncbi:MAG TPA: MoxR family ATPase [Ktedonobacteraceae bacterium]
MDDVLRHGQRVYAGKVQPAKGERDADGYPLYGYLPSVPLVEAVNLAIYLKRPLLIRGEPGSGKTRLAHAVAYELGLPYEAWQIKSTSRARDGLYTYDTLGRLRDAQLAAAGQHPAAHVSDPGSYVRWGPLGRAFQNDRRTVVLIDEIDKADIDFPNDLLLELDEQRFVVEETGENIRARQGAEPIVFITSNDEKDLPDAFLRRCLFFHIDFPDAQHLAEIVRIHCAQEPSDLIIDAAVARFLQLRKKMQEDKGEMGKMVSTSELIDWFLVLKDYPEDEVLEKLGGELPFACVLLKSWDDHQRYLQAAAPGGRL